ncbi:MAG: hypothetical protein GY856_34665 [bacterium]|nr:hypothetical protein [bacterium]
MLHVAAVIKTIGSSGRITLGKFIPADGRWLREPEVMASIDRGLRWIAENPPTKTDLEALERRIEECARDLDSLLEKALS